MTITSRTGKYDDGVPCREPLPAYVTHDGVPTSTDRAFVPGEHYSEVGDLVKKEPAKHHKNKCQICGASCAVRLCWSCQTAATRHRHAVERAKARQEGKRVDSMG